MSLIGGAMLLLAGCNLQPLYSGGGTGAVARGLADVEVGKIAGQSGWLVRNALIDRLGTGGGSPRYRLDVLLDDQIIGFGLRQDNRVSRERRTLRARFQLVDVASGSAVVDATAASDEGLDAVNSEFATIAAEQSALEHLSADIANQIVTRVALYVTRAPKGQ